MLVRQAFWRLLTAKAARSALGADRAAGSAAEQAGRAGTHITFELVSLELEGRAQRHGCRVGADARGPELVEIMFQHFTADLPLIGHLIG